MEACDQRVFVIVPPPLSLTNARLLAAVGSPCPYCGAEMAHTRRGNTPTFDHLIPRKHRKERGVTVPKIICCFGCNTDKGQLLLEEWLVIVRARGNGDAKRLATLEAFVSGHPEFATPGAAEAFIQSRIKAPQIGLPRRGMLHARGFNPTKEFRCAVCQRKFKTIQGFEVHLLAFRREDSHILIDVVEVLAAGCDTG